MMSENRYQNNQSKRRGGDRPSGSATGLIPSPYNFVPLSDRVFFPVWGKRVSIDVPFSDAISGSFEVEVEAMTPLYVRAGGDQKDDLEFFRVTADGDYAIPGTSFKGMVRNVLEIASFGNITHGTEDSRLAVRIGRSKKKAKYTIHDLIGYSDKTTARNREERDLAEMIFGTVNKKPALRGRVAMGTLIEVTGNSPGERKNTVLSSPKPTYYPNYLEQPVDAKSGKLNQGRQYNTYMDRTRIRGWKRYPVRSDGYQPQPPPPPSKKTKVSFCPLPSGTKFRGKVHIHNLLPCELGALLWVLTWGGRKALRHSLGMAKPYGYGSVSVSIVENTLALKNVADGSTVDCDYCREQYVKEMNAFTEPSGRQWLDTPQMKQLLAMADPKSSPRMKLRYPSLNEFKRYKQKNMVLLPYAEE